ncbi:uncharacterized protein LOC144445952 [Glandiceps talaboti]
MAAVFVMFMFLLLGQAVAAKTTTPLLPWDGVLDDEDNFGSGKNDGDCDSNTCLNGGTCFEVQRGFIPFCKCQKGYTGSRCEEALGEMVNSNGDIDESDKQQQQMTIVSCLYPTALVVSSWINTCCLVGLLSIVVLVTIPRYWPWNIHCKLFPRRAESVDTTPQTKSQEGVTTIELKDVSDSSNTYQDLVRDAPTTNVSEIYENQETSNSGECVPDGSQSPATTPPEVVYDNVQYN